MRVKIIGFFTEEGNSQVWFNSWYWVHCQFFLLKSKYKTTIKNLRWRLSGEIIHVTNWIRPVEFFMLANTGWNSWFFRLLMKNHWIKYKCYDKMQIFHWNHLVNPNLLHNSSYFSYSSYYWIRSISYYCTAFACL